MKIALSAYSMRQALQSGHMDLFSFLDWCARIGFSGAELTSYYFPEVFDRAYLLRLRRHAFINGITVSGTAVRNNFCLPPGPERGEQIEHVKRWIGHANDLYAPHLRIFAGKPGAGVSRSEAIAWVAESIREVHDYAAEQGVMIGLENHGGITARAREHLAICDSVGPLPWFGINLDTGNYKIHPYAELEMSAPRAVNVQLKVEVTGEQGGTVKTDYERIRLLLAQSGYRGWIALEYEAAGDPYREIPATLGELRRVFGGCD